MESAPTRKNMAARILLTTKFYSQKAKETEMMSELLPMHKDFAVYKYGML